MTSAIVLNAIGAAVLVGGWSFAVAHAHRALAAEVRRPSAALLTERGQLAQVRPVPTRQAQATSRAA